MANQKKIIENQKKLIRKISELRKNSQKQKDKREVIVNDSIKSTKKNQKDLDSASKNNQITDEHYTQATFLNSISKAIAEDVDSTDSNKLSEINENLKAIRKQISDFTKAAIDKQDTKISYTDPKRVSELKEEKSSKSKKDKDKKGILGWLASLLGLAFLPFLNILRTIFKVGRGLFKVGAGVVKGLLWLGKNILYLAKLSKNIILGAVEFFTHPVRWFKTYLWNPVKLMVTGLVGNILSRVPFLKDTKLVQNLVKGTQAAKGANAAAKQAAKADKVMAAKDKLKKVKDWGVDKVKKASETLKGAAGNLWKKIKGKVKLPGWLESRVKPIFDKICDICSKAWKKAKPILGKLWNLAKGPAKGIFKIGAKAAGRLVGFLIGAISAPPFSWVLSLALGLWFLWDFFSYLLDNGFSVSTFFAATIYALIGWDILKGDREKWESLEPLDENEAKKASNSYTDKDIRKASGDKAESMKANYSNQIKNHQKEIDRLKSKTITYKDANGNLLDSEISAKIQALKLEREMLQKEQAELHKSKIGKKNDPGWLDGEIEVKEENYQLMVDYWYDKLKNDSFFDGYFWNNNSIKYQQEKLEKIQEEMKKINSKPLMTEVEKAKQLTKLQAMAEIHQKMIEMMLNGEDEDEAIKKIRGVDRYKDLNEKNNELVAKISGIDKDLSKFGKVEETQTNAVSIKAPNNNFSPEIQSQVTAGSTSTPKAAAAAAYAWSHSKGTKAEVVAKGLKTGQCAKYVNNAIEFGGGYKGYGRGHGFQVGQSLAGIGWQPISTAHKPKIGDVAVFDRDSSTNPTYGHTAILTKGGWVSDFTQRGMSPYSNPNSLKHVSIWRDTGKQGGFGSFTGGDGGTLAPSFPISNNSLNTSGLFASTPSKEPTIVTSSAPQVPEEIKSTLDLTEYWELPV